MRLISRIGLVIGATLSVGAAQAAGTGASDEPLTQPHYHVGDSWVFERTSEAGQSGYRQDHIVLTVRQLGDGTMTVGIKADGAPTAFEEHVVGTDWSQRRLIGSEESATTRPLSFPMKSGDSWSIDYVDPTQRGNQISDHVRRTYRVIGWQEVSVPAGSFHAMVIEAKGVDEAEFSVPATVASLVAATPGNATSVSHAQQGGRRLVRQITHARFFYVPETRNWVKSEEERFNTDDVLISRETRQLTKFTLSDSHE